MNHFLMTTQEAVLATVWPLEQCQAVGDGLVREVTVAGFL